MEPNRKDRIARSLRAAAAALLVIGFAACGDAPPSGQAAKPGTRPVDQSAAKAPEPAPPPATKPDAPAAAAAAPTGRPSADVELAARVKSALETDAALRALAVDVTAAGGAVTLFGTADTAANRDKAAKLAAGVPGVTSVQNQIVIVRGS